MLLCLLLLKDAVYRLFVVEWFYSDNGVVPRQALWDGLARDIRFSLLDALPASWMTAAVILIWIVVLFCLMLGYRARLMAVLNFILILSIHERNVYILTGADTAMRVFSFWLIAAVFSQSAVLLRLQFALIYVFTAYLKLIEPIWTRGEALFYVLQLDSLLLPPGRLLAEYAPQELLTVLTYFVLVTELSLPFLLLFAPRRLRLMGMVLGISLHIGIGLTLAIPDFSLVMLIGYTLFFDPRWRTSNQIAPPKPVRFLNLILSPLIVLVIWWNIDVTRQYRENSVPPMPQVLENVMWISGLWQYWDLFAPVPYQIDGQIIVEGIFENGIRYDLFNQQPLDAEVTPIQWGPNMRWRKFEEVMFRNQYPQILSAWSRNYCARYNDNSSSVTGTRLAEVHSRYHYRRSHAPGEAVNSPQTELLWSHNCLSN